MMERTWWLYNSQWSTPCGDHWSIRKMRRTSPLNLFQFQRHVVVRRTRCNNFVGAIYPEPHALRSGVATIVDRESWSRRSIPYVLTRPCHNAAFSDTLSKQKSLFCSPGDWITLWMDWSRSLPAQSEREKTTIANRSAGCRHRSLVWNPLVIGVILLLINHSWFLIIVSCESWFILQSSRVVFSSLIKSLWRLCPLSSSWDMYSWQCSTCHSAAFNQWSLMKHWECSIA